MEFELDFTLCDLLDGAIKQHRAEHNGLYPRAIMLHPTLYESLLSEANPNDWVEWRSACLYKYKSVVVEFNWSIAYPGMITCRGEVVPI